MLFKDALVLITRMIKNEEKHQDYKRTVDLAEQYRALITGDDIGAQLIQFIQREDKELFEQRCRLTKSITPAVAASVRKPFNKVTRNDRVKTSIKLSTKEREIIVQSMIKGFYGDSKKSKGLDYWMNTRFLELQFGDPNSWVVIEWDAPNDEVTPVEPRPFEVKACDAINFYVVNDNVKWLFISQCIEYKEAGHTDLAPKVRNGTRFTLYDEDITVVFEQVDRAYLTESGYQLEKGEELVDIKADTYLVKLYNPNLGTVPAVRIGYNRDELTEGRTFVNPWHEGLCYFEKMLTTVSEFDLTMHLHTFPQKLQYVQKCQGTESKKCNRGWEQGSSNVRCSSCKGTGYKIHTTAQEAILLPMPDDPKEMMDLSKIIEYKAPPIELIKFQNDYTLQLERQVHQSVFNSQVFVKNNYAGSNTQPGGQPIEATATGVDMNMQSVYDTLEPYTEKASEVYIDFVTIFAILSGDVSKEDIQIVRSFPADFKLKTSDALMAERKVARDSGAPAFLISTIDDDLAQIIYTGDLIGMQKYKVKNSFNPFPGKTDDEIALLLISNFVRKYDKVLYSNFEQIFKEIETEKIGFYVYTLKKQIPIVEAKVAEFLAEVETAPAGINDPNFKNNNPANDPTPEQIQQVKDMTTAGKTPEEIATETGLTVEQIATITTGN